METFKGDTLRHRHDFQEKKRNQNRQGLAVCKSQPNFSDFKRRVDFGETSTGLPLEDKFG
jgi:hypothetical protein